MIDPPSWEECLPKVGGHGYPKTATVEIYMRAIERIRKNTIGPTTDS